MVRLQLLLLCLRNYSDDGLWYLLLHPTNVEESKGASCYSLQHWHCRGSDRQQKQHDDWHKVSRAWWHPWDSFPRMHDAMRCCFAIRKLHSRWVHVDRRKRSGYQNPVAVQERSHLWHEGACTSHTFLRHKSHSNTLHRVRTSAGSSHQHWEHNGQGRTHQVDSIPSTSRLQVRTRFLQVCSTLGFSRFLWIRFYSRYKSKSRKFIGLT